MKRHVPNVPGVTIFADASVDPACGAGGWAAWMVGGGKASSMASGQLRDLVYTSDDAEILALANGLHVAEGRGYLADQPLVMLQSDNSSVLSLVRGYFRVPDSPVGRAGQGCTIIRAKPRTWERSEHRRRKQALSAMAEVVARTGLRMVVRHVKGHRHEAALSGTDGRAWVNRECDRLAKKAMRARRIAILAAVGDSEGAAA